jgi:hypothetical protein
MSQRHPVSPPGSSRRPSPESAEDVTIELEGFTRADLGSASLAKVDELRSVLSLFGPPPIVFTKAGEAYRSIRNRLVHADRDHEELSLAHEVARRLALDPAIVTSAREHIARRLHNASPNERGELREWDSILKTMSVPRLQRFLVDSGERATRLRQSMPFLSVLSSEERAKILTKARS